MPRPPRQQLTGALYRVASRGNGRARVFFGGDDGRRSLSQLRDCLTNDHVSGGQLGAGTRQVARVRQAKDSVGFRTPREDAAEPTLFFTVCPRRAGAPVAQASRVACRHRRTVAREIPLGLGREQPNCAASARDRPLCANQLAAATLTVVAGTSAPRATMATGSASRQATKGNRAFMRAG